MPKPMPATDTDVLIVGGGIVGLSTGLQLKRLNPAISVIVIEKDAALAAQQTGHNSGVLHAGIYYKPGSLKARFCVEGHRELAAFCARHEIPVWRCGKVIVASSDADSARLARLHEFGRANGVQGLRVVCAAELAELEPAVSGTRALYAPNSAVLDFRQVADAFAREFERLEGRVYTGTRFLSATAKPGRHIVATSRGEFTTKLLVNCAGLQSDLVARQAGATPQVRIIPFRGEYFELAERSRSLVNGLVYPVPDPALPFLDVHFTPRIGGGVEAGPNAVLATRREGYRRGDFSLREFAYTLGYPGFWRLAMKNIAPGLAEIHRSLRKPVFVASLQRLVPAITADDLIPGGAGVRAQAVDRHGRLLDDFHVEESVRAIHLLNAPSPAATSSIPIGRHLAHMAAARIA